MSKHTFTKEHRENLRLSKLGKRNHFYGKVHSDETKAKMSKVAKLRFAKMTDKDKDEYFFYLRGNHYRFIEDRTKLKKDNERNDSAYHNWRKEIYERDNVACKINNKSCNGRIEAHHILSWREYPELRYDINNGITLCQSHHPRKWDEEKRLVSELQELVSVSS